MSTDAISRIRRFNRAVTAEVGALDTSFLGRGRPLGTARVLNAIGHGRGEVGAIRDYLGLDSGLMSRLLRGLEEEGLVVTLPHPADARRRVAALTEAGRREFSAYEALSNAQATALVERFPRGEELLRAIKILEKHAQQLSALHYSSFDDAPLGSGDEQWDKVNFPGTVCS